MSNSPRLNFGTLFDHFGTLWVRFGSLLVSFGALWLPFGLLGLTFGDPGARFSHFRKALASFFIFLCIFDGNIMRKYVL